MAVAEIRSKGGDPAVAAAECGERPLLRAKGWNCIAAAHAFAAEPQLFRGVEFTDPPPSWTELVTNPDPANDSYAIGVWGALEEYDWVDLVPADVFGVVGLAGIEPATPTLKVSCSTN